MAELVGAPGEVQRFAVDWMLGRLARWLRILGHDVAYGRHLRDRTLVDSARREERLLLTRDTRLLRDPHLPRHLFVESAVPLGGAPLLTRCLDCNRPLDEVPRDQVRDRVPPYVWDTAPRFLACGRCGRVYWPATHRAHMLRELAAIGIVHEERA